MPEYPEVNTFIRQLKNDNILCQQILKINIIDQKIIKNSSIIQFKKFILYEKIKNINQIGKLIVIELSNNKYLTIHLRLEGHLYFIDFYNKSPRYTMIELLCKDKKLVYCDSRKFGTFNIYWSKQELFESNEIKNMGYQPFDKKLTKEYLLQKFKNIRSPIKTTLLNQSIIAGIGNIYADEILFESKINPFRSTNKININECKKIIDSMHKIFILSINNFGTTISSYSFAPNHNGNYQKYLKVHGRYDKQCFSCKTLIKKVKIGNRGTYYCPKCQSL